MMSIADPRNLLLRILFIFFFSFILTLKYRENYLLLLCTNLQDEVLNFLLRIFGRWLKYFTK